MLLLRRTRQLPCRSSVIQSYALSHGERCDVARGQVSCTSQPLRLACGRDSSVLAPLALNRSAFLINRATPGKSQQRGPRACCRGAQSRMNSSAKRIVLFFLSCSPSVDHDHFSLGDGHTRGCQERGYPVEKSTVYVSGHARLAPRGTWSARKRGCVGVFVMPALTLLAFLFSRAFGRPWKPKIITFF